MTRKYPDKFVVECPAWDFKWDVTYVPQADSYLWVNSADGGSIGHFSTEAMDALNRTDYKFIFPELLIREEPELVFPFTIRHKDGTGPYVLTSAGDSVDVLDEEGNTHTRYWTKQECKDFIKNGTWIVQSVGCSYTKHEGSIHDYVDVRDNGEPVEAPQSDVEPIVVGSIQIGTGTSLARIRKLTEAVNTLAEAWVNLNNIMKKGLGDV